MKKLFTFCAALILSMAFFSCDKKGNEEAKVTVQFTNQVLLFDGYEPLTVEAIISDAVKSELRVPFSIEGTSVKNVDYSLSAEEFVFEAGKKSANIVVTPLVTDKDGNIKLVLKNGAGYTAGNRSILTVTVNAQQNIIYSFDKRTVDLLGDIDISVNILGLSSGSGYSTPFDIVLPLEVLPTSTAVEGTDFAFVDNAAKTVTIKKGEKSGMFKLRMLTPPADGSKTINLKLGAPKDNAKIFEAGNFETIRINVIDITKDLAGTWSYSGFPNLESDFGLLYYLQILGYSGNTDDPKLLPRNNSVADKFVIESTVEENVYNFTPTMTGDIGKFFRESKITNLGSGNVKTHHFEKEETLECLDFKFEPVNYSFSASGETLKETKIAIRITDEGKKLTMYIYEYKPTEFYVQTVGDLETQLGATPGDNNWALFIGLVYEFDRVVK